MKLQPNFAIKYFWINIDECVLVNMGSEKPAFDYGCEDTG